MRAVYVKRDKQSAVIVYTGEGKGKTSASLGLVCRILGSGGKVAFIQFIKTWKVSEDHFLKAISPVFKDQLTVYKGGRGFYNAGDLSAPNVTKKEHSKSARRTYEIALKYASSGKYQAVICDEINNAVHDGLLTKKDLKELIAIKHPSTNLCLTGRNFPKDLHGLVDIISNMDNIKHHFDDGYEAMLGVDF